MAQNNKPYRFGANSGGRRFTFEGKNLHTGQTVRGEVAAKDEDDARRKLLRRGIKPLHLGKLKTARRRRITQEDITVFTRQLAAMMKAGLPLLQAFEIVARGHANPAVTQMLLSIRSEVEQGSPLSQSFAKHPKYFDRFYCNLVAAGETGGVLETLLDKLAVYKEKTQAVKKKVKTALTYPAAVVIAAVSLIFVMMVFVLPEFKEVYANIGAELPWATQIVMDMSDWFVEYGWLMLALLPLAGWLLHRWHKHSPDFQRKTDALALNLPLVGAIVRKAMVARWARTTATLFAAGVPLVEALSAVAAASGNRLYEEATLEIRADVTQGLPLAACMRRGGLFPNMMVQMTAIGEETGSLDDMLGRAAEFYEDEVDNAVARISSLIEPVIMAVLGGIIGILLVVMYLPLFNLGNAVG